MPSLPLSTEPLTDTLESLVASFFFVVVVVVSFPNFSPQLASKLIIANLFLWCSLVPFLLLCGNQFAKSPSSVCGGS